MRASSGLSPWRRYSTSSMLISWRVNAAVSISGSCHSSLITPSVLELLRRPRLLERVRLVEGLELHALVEDPHHGGYRGGVAVEEPRPEYLGRDADVGEGRRVAVAVAPGLFLFREMRLDCLQPFHDPVLAPAGARRFVHLELLLKIVADARDEQGMAVARDDLREPAHAGATLRILRQERRLRVGLVQVLDDRHRLEE